MKFTCRAKESLVARAPAGDSVAGSFASAVLRAGFIFTAFSVVRLPAGTSTGLDAACTTAVAGIARHHGVLNPIAVGTLLLFTASPKKPWPAIAFTTLPVDSAALRAFVINPCFQ